MCCGANKSQFRSPTRIPQLRTPQTQHRSGSTPAAAPSAARPSVLFEYTGKTGLTVVGPSTGIRYRFDSPGAQLAVDPRDQSTLLYVPNLRPVRFTRNT
jgi:hypothetical protein